MREWVNASLQAPPLDTEVEIKFFDQNNMERVAIDKLIHMMNGTYIYSYGDYTRCLVTAWRELEIEE